MTSAILGGFTYDLVKSGMAFSTKYVVNSLHKKASESYIAEPDVLEEIVTQLQGLSEEQRATQQSLVQAIDTHQTIQSLLEQIQPIDQSTTIVQNISGSHAKVAGRDYNEHNYLPEKKTSPNT